MGRLLLLAACLVGAFAQTVTPEKQLERALQRHQTGDIEDAIVDYRAYLGANPNAFQIRSNLGAALVRAGRYEEAIEEYRKALAGESGNAGIRLNLALAYYKSGQLTLASEELVTLRGADPANRQLLLLLAACYLRLDLNRKVIDLLGPLKTRGEDDMPVDYLLGTAYIRDRRPEAGAELIDKILRQGDSAEARLLLGTAKMMAEDYSGAIADLAKAIELNPALPDVYSYYGNSLLGVGDPEAAAKAFRKELSSNPADFTANLQLGILAKDNRDYDSAMPYFVSALRARPGSLAVRYQIASLKFLSGNIDQAQAELEAMVKESPQFAEAHVTLATIYYRLKRKQDGDRERAIVKELNTAQQEKETRKLTNRDSVQKAP